MRGAVAAFCLYAIALLHINTARAQAADCSQPKNALGPPPNAYLVQEFDVVGTQNYTCGPDNQFVWVGIDAKMLINGQNAGYAYSSLTEAGDFYSAYVMTDVANNSIGSVKSMRVDIKADIPDPNSMPWILRYTFEPEGTLADVHYMWRHNTSGGIGPVTEPCVLGESESVYAPFNAIYSFYSCRKQPNNAAPRSKGVFALALGILGGFFALIL